MAGVGRELRFDIVPVVQSWQRRFPGKHWAGLSILAGDRNLNDHRFGRSDSIDTRIYTDIDPIAEWLKANASALLNESSSAFFATGGDPLRASRAWSRSGTTDADEDRGWSWRSRHFLRFADPGAWLPNIAIQVDDDDVVVAWDRQGIALDGAPDFISEPGSVRCSRRSFWSSCMVLMEHAGLPATSSDILPQPSWEDPWIAEEDGMARLLLGVRTDFPDRSPAELIAFQAAQDATPGPRTSDALSRLEGLGFSAPSAAKHLDVSSAQTLGGQPYDEGYESARHLRDAMAVPYDRIDPPSLAATLGVHLERGGAGDPSGTTMVCGRRGEHPGSLIVFDAPRPWMQSMSTMTAFGHLLMDRLNESGVAGAAASTRRSRGRRAVRARAFAAEMLLPAAGVERLLRGMPSGAVDPNTFPKLLDHYGVGASLAANHLYNTRFIPTTDARDAFIEEFAAA